MNIWNSIKKFFTKVAQDEAVKAAADTAKDAAKEVAVDYFKDKAKQEFNRHK
ncbi:hypothetical protein HLBENOHH_02087 [Aeromonas dhakensis]|uniref:hypothetical protein n=1 Tax=Aeromonas dhakensis TaxID=196024 RepID=UPI00366E7654